MLKESWWGCSRMDNLEMAQADTIADLRDRLLACGAEIKALRASARPVGMYRGPFDVVSGWETVVEPVQEKEGVAV
jgi:hypothetical protein